MRKDNKATNEQLKELYQAASEFAQIKPWKAFYDADIICVENPRDKEIGYCSIMGIAGEHYALGVYLGNNGIFGFCHLMTHAESIPSHQVMHHQNCLMCSFEDRELLSPEDRKQIKDLGLTFRGRNAWPMFRRYEPGYHPWYINEEECIFLTHALKQTLLVAGNVLSGQLKMDMEEGKTILRYSEEKGDKLEWYSKEVQLKYPTVSYSPVKINDDILIKKIKMAGSMGNVSLQVDTLYMPSPVQENEDERPYYPRASILAEQKSGQVLDFEVYEDVSDDADVTLNKLINMCLKNGIPKEIQVRSESMKAILKDFCMNTGIKLKVLKRLSAIDQMINEMAIRF